MPPPAYRIAYVAVLDKPWDLVSNGSLEVDAGCTVLLYVGLLKDRDVARVIKPLGAGELVNFSKKTKSQGFAWRGRADPLDVKSTCEHHVNTLEQHFRNRVDHFMPACCLQPR